MNKNGEEKKKKKIEYQKGMGGCKGELDPSGG
jgi:hypothetical protein